MRERGVGEDSGVEHGEVLLAEGSERDDTRGCEPETLEHRRTSRVPATVCGIDLHRRRSVIVRMNDAGEVLAVTKVDNDPVQLSMVIAEAGPDLEVALEACYG